ncbi:hypothetical protein N7488_008938 [Penicillium malachiteum]|nr:hypothetical protein N7488_008938 [Penicillium malachiteum]
MVKDSTLHTITSVIYALLAYFAPGFRWAWLGLAICFAGLAFHERNQYPSQSGGDRARTVRKLDSGTS